MKCETHKQSNMFKIPFRLPSYNEYIRECRANKDKGAQFKKDVESGIIYAIKKAVANKELQSIEKSCEIYIHWYEENKRRDVDNVQSGQKFILDALVQCGILKDDGRKYVKNIHHRIYDNKGNSFVIVRIVVCE